MLAAVALALSVALVVPQGTAQAAQASESVITAISPGTDTVGGTPMVPTSVISTSGGLPGGMSDYLPGLLWNGGGDVANSMMLDAFDQVTNGGTKLTNTGHGFQTGRSFCEFSVDMADTDWGLSVPRVVTWTVTSYGKTVGTTQSYCEGRPVPKETVTCYDPSWSSGPLRIVLPSQAGNNGTLVNACAGASATAVPIMYTVDPSSGTAITTTATDGGQWVNPQYRDLLASVMVVSVSKTCKNASTGATSTVQVDGQPGTGTVPNAVCPPGTYPISQRIWAHPQGLSNVGQDLGTTSLAPGAFDQYGDCLGPQLACALSVWIDGVKCAFLLVDCDKWADPDQVSPDRVECRWGNYLMPASDCNVLKNCYGVPIDSVGVGQAGDPTQCGINPNGRPSDPPEHVSGGKIVDPDDPGDEPSDEPSDDPTDDPTGPSQPQPTIIVTVKPTINVTVQPTINVNVPQPTVNVTVNAPNQGPVDIPQGRDGSECWPTGSAKYNPLDWAYTPMHCAMSKLLMPTPGKGAALLDDLGEDQPFKGWTDAIGDMAGSFGVSAGGCQGPPLNLGYPFHKTLYPASACDEPMATVAKISRAGTGAVLIIGGLWSAVAAILQGIGYNVRSGSDD
jgi:hypothetical protein